MSNQQNTATIMLQEIGKLLTGRIASPEAKEKINVLLDRLTETANDDPADLLPAVTGQDASTLRNLAERVDEMEISVNKLVEKDKMRP